MLAVIVHINDTYIVEERKDRQLPGFPRLISTVNKIREFVSAELGKDRTLVLHSGDFIGPSLLSKRDRGEEMINQLELLGLDYCILGNHEFDYESSNSSVLKDHLETSNFGVVLSNANSTDSQFQKHINEVIFWPSEDEPLIAIMGIISQSVARAFKPKENWDYEELHVTLDRVLPKVKNSHYQIVLTHADREDDRQIRDILHRWNYSGPRKYGETRKNAFSKPLILGGHDHDIDWGECDGIPIYKNEANLKNVRVFCLYGGGISAYPLLQEELLLYESHLFQQERLDVVLKMMEGEDAEAYKFFYPTDIDKFLHVFEDFERSIVERQLAESNPNATEQSPIPYGLAISKLQNYPYYYLTRSLKYQDFLPPDPAAQESIDKCLKIHTSSNAFDIMLDASGRLDFFEGRESYSRSMPTNLGCYFAEAIRLYTNSDLAIINSGAIRCDDTYPAKLSRYDIEEMFLYDSDDAISIVEMPKDIASALIEYGTSNIKRHTGGYPQYYPKTLPAKEIMMVAVPSYWFFNDNCTDGYIEFIAEYLKKSIDETRRSFSTDNCCSIIEAASKCIGKVLIDRDVLEDHRSDSEDAFITFFNLADILIDSFDDLDFFIAINKYKEGLGSDAPMENLDIMACRDHLRSFYRNTFDLYPLLKDIEQIEQLPENERQNFYEINLRDKIYEKHNLINDFRDRMRSHRRMFMKNRDYSSVYDITTNRILPTYRR